MTEVEQNGSPETVEKVTKLLDAEMALETEFAANVRQMAQQIINIQSQTAETAGRDIYKQTAGRDILNVQDAGQGNKFGGS